MLGGVVGAIADADLTDGNGGDDAGHGGVTHDQAAAIVKLVDDALAVDGRTERPAHFRFAEDLAVEVEAQVEQHLVGDDAHLLRRARGQRVALGRWQGGNVETAVLPHLVGVLLLLEKDDVDGIDVARRLQRPERVTV